MNILKIRKDLSDVGFSVLPFPKLIKEVMINYVKNFLYETNQKHFKQADDIDHYERSGKNVIAMSDNEYIKIFAKPFRMYPDDIAKLILDWVKGEFPKIFGVERVDSNYVSPAEREINQKLHHHSYDVFWRCIRPQKYDVGPAHCDYQFWDLAKNTDSEVPVPFLYRERWKIWTPMLGCVKENMLQVMPFSHNEKIPVTVTETPFGKRPWLEPQWYEKNKNRFIVPVENMDECVIFHDRLVHRGQKNNTTNLRISSELTILIP